MLRLYRDPTAEARSPAARSACFPHPVQMSQRGVRAAVQKAHLVVYHDESYYTYRPSDAVAVRTSHVDDVRAGYSPWHGGPRGVLSGPPGVRDVYFLPIRPHRRTSLLRLGSELSAVAGQRCVLA